MTVTQERTLDQLLASEALAAWRHRQAGGTEPELALIGAHACPACGDGLLQVQTYARHTPTEDGLRIATGQLLCPMREYETCTFEPRFWDVTVSRQGGYLIASVAIEGTLGALVPLADCDDLQSLL